MIVKKLAVPFINEKLLSQAEHCYIASAGLSEQGFDLVVNRLSLKCKVEIVTGLDLPTSPTLLRRIFRHFPDRVRLHLYTKNFFHANVYIFDLPYRKSVAFAGSGNVSLGGLKDHEELFYKITDAKEIEGLKSWFIGYYEYAEVLTEPIIDEYEWVYPSIKQREIASRQEIRDVLALTTRGFNWDNIKFKNQYFKKEDFLTFANSKASLNTPEIREERARVKDKLLQLHESIKDYLSTIQLHEDHDSERIISSQNPVDHPDNKLREMWIGYGRSEAALKRHSPTDSVSMRLMIIVRQAEIGIWLMPGGENAGKTDQEYFHKKMKEPDYRKAFFERLTGLHPAVGNKVNTRGDYWIQVAGEKKFVSSFLNEAALWEFTRYDEWPYYSFVIGKSFLPGSPETSNENIASTVKAEFDKLLVLYKHIQHQESED